MKKNGRILICLLMTMGVFLMVANRCTKVDDNNPATGGTLTDIDSNVYKTVTIGTQVWMTENLKTTKYRNGDPISNVTNFPSWSGLTTGAYCWYLNTTRTRI